MLSYDYYASFSPELPPIICASPFLSLLDPPSQQVLLVPVSLPPPTPPPPLPPPAAAQVCPSPPTNENLLVAGRQGKPWVPWDKLWQVKWTVGSVQYLV